MFAKVVHSIANFANQPGYSLRTVTGHFASVMSLFYLRCTHLPILEISLLELNLEGNLITPELGFAGILHIIEALAENNYLEELNLSGNAVPNELHTLQVDFSPKYAHN
ncbi:hypothetical protein K1719_028847 [Acacia pycnantha]|nr:hypothetical protein K1719_028847 [Acacia pycnantha]